MSVISAAPQTHEERFYRHLMGGSDLASFRVEQEESDLWIAVDRSSFTPDLLEVAVHALRRTRQQIVSHISAQPHFRTALSPLEVPETAPPVVRAMAAAARRAEVGPMAAVAGAVAEEVASALLAHVHEVIVENGGDIVICGHHPRRVAILAGTSPFSLRVGLLVAGDGTIRSVCTSAGTWGHSLSLGQADAAVAVAASGPLADAAATRLGNLVQTEADLPQAVARARDIAGLTGCVLIKGSKLAAWGDIELTGL